MRRIRARRKRGTYFRTITITGPELDRFEAASYLDRADRGDPAAEARAIETAVSIDGKITGRMIERDNVQLARRVDVLVKRRFVTEPR